MSFLTVVKILVLIVNNKHSYFMMDRLWIIDKRNKINTLSTGTAQIRCVFRNLAKFSSTTVFCDVVFVFKRANAFINRKTMEMDMLYILTFIPEDVFN